MAEHEFLAGLNEKWLTDLAGCASTETHRAGDFVFRQGQESTGLLLIQRGRVAIEIASPGRDAMTLVTAGRGDISGWTCLFPPYRHRFDARAVDLTRVVSLDAACLRDILDADSELGREIFRRIALVVVGRLESARVQLLDLYGPR